MESPPATKERERKKRTFVGKKHSNGGKSEAAKWSKRVVIVVYDDSQTRREREIERKKERKQLQGRPSAGRSVLDMIHRCFPSHFLGLHGYYYTVH